MRHFLSLLFLLLLVEGKVFGQVSMTTSGDWATASNWSSNNIGDVVTENATFSNGINPIVNSPGNFTVGDMGFGNNNTLTIKSGASLNIGDVTHAKSLTSGNGTTVTVDGTLTIWGDLNVNNNMIWNITGSVIIKGNVIMGNGAGLTVTGGNLKISGNFTGGNNTTVSVPSGSITVGGSVDTGNGSTLTGCAGCFQKGGSCTGPSTFCTNSVLPITLLSFKGKSNGSIVTLEWTAAIEGRFDRFVVERLTNNGSFSEIGSVVGDGNTSLTSYSFEDQTPVIGSNFYRLRSVDYDGLSQSSGIVEVEISGEVGDKVTLYPNPVIGGAFDIITNFEQKDGDRLMIYNSVGFLVGQTPVAAGGVKFGDSMPAGVYTLWYVSAEKRSIVRFVVR
jgi:hypothetical protein